MNTEKSQSGWDQARVAAYAVGVFGTFIIMGLLVLALRHYTHTAPAGANRSQERYKNLQEVRAASAKALDTYDWKDPAKGIVRLPIGHAMELALEELRNPAAARSNLNLRADKFYPPPPPPGPPQPNPFE